MPRNAGQHKHTIAAVAALFGAVGILLFLIVGSGVVAQRSPGVVHSTEIRVAPEISGRLARFAVTRAEGRRFAAHEFLELVSPERSAALVLANAQLDEARAGRDRIYAGIRKERVDVLEREIETNKSNLLYAEQEFARKSRLAADSFASRQDLDKAAAAVATARAKLAAAEKTYEAAHLGPTREELAIADAKVENAAMSVSVIAAQVAKLKILAPTDGVIAVIVAEPGEAIIPGQPVLTMEATGRRWTSFNLREDQFGELRIGSPVDLLLAGGVDRIAARVTEIIPRGEFAVWRAARVVGDHDLNTFLLRADPIDTTDGELQPGMTVWLQIPSRVERQ